MHMLKPKRAHDLATSSRSINASLTLVTADGVKASPFGSHSKSHPLHLTLAPLGALFLEPVGRRP